MRKFILTLMLSLLTSSAVSAFWAEATDSSLEIGVGYRNDSIKYKREFSPFSSGSDSYGNNYNNSEFNTNSSLDWKNLNIWFIEARGKYVTCDCVYLRGSVDYGWITSGKLKNKEDYGFGSGYFDNSFSFSGRDKSHVKGNVYDAKIAVGYQFKWCDEALSIAPLVGYSWHGHELRNGRHGDSSYSSYSPSSCDSYDSYYSYYSDCSYSDYSSSSSSSSSSFSSSSSDKHHKLTDRWNGVFIGFDLDYRFCCEWNFFFNYEYHWAQFHAKEHGHNRLLFNNNLDNSESGYERHCKSHIHANNASGNVIDFGVEWDLCDCWVLGLRAEFQWWTARHAHERTKVVDRSCGDVGLECAFKTPIKHVTWNSGSIVLDLGMVF